MSKRRRKTKDFSTNATDLETGLPAFDPGLMEAPRGKRPKGKAWGKHKRANQKSAYYD